MNVALWVAHGWLAVIMGGAIATHLRRKEPAAVPAVLLALFVAAGRFSLFG
jgi:hypothetical protein